MTVTRRPEWPRSGTNQLVDGVVAAGWHEAGGAADCVPRLVRWRDRSHTPPRGATLMGRVRRCTTALRRVRASRSETNAGTRLARGSARSSGQTVAALGATRLQHSTAATSGHPGPKAVLLRPLQVVRLVGALHTSLLGSAALGCATQGHQGRKETGQETGRACATTSQGYGLGCRDGNQHRRCADAHDRSVSNRLRNAASVPVPAPLVDPRRLCHCPHCVDNDVETTQGRRGRCR